MIKRYFSEEYLINIRRDFFYLLKLINSSHGEYYFAIRDNYFNIYYKGNSLAKIYPKSDKTYSVFINNKFFENTKADNGIYFISKNKIKDYNNIRISSKQIHPFFQIKHFKEFSSKIKEVNIGEEIEFEQAIITDNLNSDKIIFIDRQITDDHLKGKRIDLLALKKIESGEYQFLVCEVKLGNNKELKCAVYDQLQLYVNHINKYFNDYKECYEKQYNQKRILGLFDKTAPASIKISKQAIGIIIVCGYSGIAKSHIKDLEKSYPNIKVIHFKYALDNLL